MTQLPINKNILIIIANLSDYEDCFTMAIASKKTATILRPYLTNRKTITKTAIRQVGHRCELMISACSLCGANNIMRDALIAKYDEIATMHHFPTSNKTWNKLITYKYNILNNISNK